MNSALAGWQSRRRYSLSIEAHFGVADETPKPLAGRHVVITSGPTHEPIDPVRYIANRSSGKQGHAIARAALLAGARVTLVAGPVTISDPAGVTMVHVETARADADGGRGGIACRYRYFRGRRRGLAGRRPIS